MKKNLFYAMAIAAAFTACSEDNEAVKNPSAEATKGYMTFNIELPSMASTRAGTENDQFAEGENDEYYVDDMHIVLLDNANKIVQIESSKKTAWQNPENTNNNVERISATISIESETTPVKALVILNKPTSVALNSGSIWENSLTLTEAITGFYDNTGTNKVAKGITMTNAAIVSGGSIQDLTPLEGHIFTSQAEAMALPVTVYVERVIAKVSVKQDNSILSGSSTVPTGIASVTINSWKLDLTNKSTYLMRQYETDWATTGYTATGKSENRMIGTSENPKRVYWAKDMNYSDEDKTGGVYTNGFNSITNMTSSNSLTDVEYCLENTFNVANQNQDQTTRVVFKTTITATGESSNIDLFTIGSSSQLYNAENLIKVISNVAKENGVTPGTLSTTYDANAGAVTIDNNMLKTVLDLSSDLDGDVVTNISNALGGVTCYNNGECYYAARIKHFGDELTPWISTNDNYGDEPNASKNWLGRYGVVRNNWYELTVTGIKKLGYATVTDIPEESTPDDEKTQYMELEIRILSWAKRSQEVEL